MMIREFVDRTGFEPTATEYAAIEEKYYSFDGSKDEFCKAGKYRTPDNKGFYCKHWYF